VTRTTIRSEDITAGQVKAADLASDAVDTTGIQTDIAILGFKVAANGSLSKYNLADQTIDAFEDATGIDTSASINEARNASDYYSGEVSVAGNATGGTITTYTSGSTYKVHTLTNGQDFVAPSSGTVDFLIVGGGGGGGWGGGGAGGVVYGTSQSITAATYTAVVGSGGGSSGSSTSCTGIVGDDSTFNSFTAKGGGAGGAYAVTGGIGGNGGGGGMGNPTGALGGGENQDAYSGTTNVTGYGEVNTTYGGGGYNGGNGNDNGSQGGAGAGGQAAWVPAANRTSDYDWDTYAGGGPGGPGLSNSITGSAVFYAGGGGGAQGDYTTGGAGGSGGGGQGAVGGYTSAGGDGTDGLGGGGGGGFYEPGGTGGNGTVIVSYVEDSFSTLGPGNLTLISNATTAEATPTKGDIVMAYTNGAGTATVNTDIKGWISRDNGTTYTQATLTDDGDTGGHTILTAHDLDISSQPSGTSMRYKITTHNQSASKETRIQAVSLGWS